MSLAVIVANAYDLDMSIIHLDPVALQSRYDSLIAEAERIRRVLDLVPEIEALSIDGVDENASSAGQASRQNGSALRAADPEILGKLREFVRSYPAAEFDVPTVIEWIRKRDPQFDEKRHRDAITLALRHLVADATLRVKVEGVGRRLQVWEKMNTESEGSN